MSHPPWEMGKESFGGAAMSSAIDDLAAPLIHKEDRESNRLHSAPCS